jgi:hypothetical protein
MPQQTSKSKDPLVCIATAPNEIIASMWKGILEENGIRSMLKSVSFMETAQYTHSLFPYEVYVLASEAGRAREVLEPFLEEK